MIAVVARLRRRRHAGIAWSPSAGDVAQPSRSRRRPRPKAAHLSIVVLPFANLSGDPGQDYFADGITENLTTDLSRIRGTFVIARNTAFTFKGKSVDAKKIGKELGVRYVLEGSVQRDQTECASTRSSSTPRRGAHLWAERFDKPRNRGRFPGGEVKNFVGGGSQN